MVEYTYDRLQRITSEKAYLNYPNSFVETKYTYDLAGNVTGVTDANGNLNEDGYNWYVYGNQNPVMYIDPTGYRSIKESDQIIKNNAQNIINAASEFGVNPGILAATIYAEQRLNVSWKDDWVDPFVSNAVDVSLGVAQIRISTAIKIEDAGYMDKTVYYEWHNNHMTENRQSGIILKLQNDKENIRYAAAYLAYFQNRWKRVYPEIDGRTAILATLYNQGERRTPHSSPQANPFGEFAKDNYYHVRELLGLK